MITCGFISSQFVKIFPFDFAFVARTAETPRADDGESQQIYRAVERPSGGAENTYCDFQRNDFKEKCRSCSVSIATLHLKMKKAHDKKQSKLLLELLRANPTVTSSFGNEREHTKTKRY
ncbi:uncharacterized protein LOC124273188 [Haliotis rubra]|uniref:uncharacterized protein LOC124273188 n=1 Tax=Haliotis rubra TaxID=36100 RepID=UPI001EE512CC|nr:uncharacterized protein LOC124273188 [Haliotis rubra]